MVTKTKIIRDLYKLTFLLLKQGVYEYDYSPLEGYIKHIEYTIKRNSPFTLNYGESKLVDYLNNVIDHIEKDIMTDKHTYLWKQDKNLKDFEKGVMSAIRLIMFRIHCICD